MKKIGIILLAVATVAAGYSQSVLSTNKTHEETVGDQVNVLRNAPADVLSQLYDAWARAYALMWGDKEGVTPAERLAALGPEAAELFALNEALTVFMITTLTGKRDDLVADIQARLATRPDVTIHEDGTVTIDEPDPTPTPTPTPTPEP